MGESKFPGPGLNFGNPLAGVDVMDEFAHKPIVKSLRWCNEAATQLFAAALAGSPALANAFIELRGELGAGKTTLVRHLLRALGVTGRVKSPTYAVVEPYELADLNIWHFDFFRFNDPREWDDAGFRDIFATTGLKLAEWPDKAHGFIPRADLVIELAALEDESREVKLIAQTAVGGALLEAACPPGSGRPPVEPP